MMMSVEQSVEWELAGETEAPGEYLPQYICPPQIPHDLTWARTRAAASATNHLSYGMANNVHILTVYFSLIYFNIIPSLLHLGYWYWINSSENKLSSLVVHDYLSTEQAGVG
jgi:hypothetical protein